MATPFNSSSFCNVTIAVWKLCYAEYFLISVLIVEKKRNVSEKYAFLLRPIFAIFCRKTSAGCSQLINEPTHFVNKTSSCSDSIFSSDVNITSNYGIEKTIHEKCHHHIIYGTLNFNVALPPHYYRENWDYKNTENTQKAISMYIRIKIQMKTRILTYT